METAPPDIGLSFSILSWKCNLPGNFASHLPRIVSRWPDLVGFAILTTYIDYTIGAAGSHVVFRNPSLKQVGVEYHNR